MTLTVVIIGAGIGGPAAAVGLARNGRTVTLLEQATSTSGIGYAFRITPNSERCLKHLAVDVVEGGAVRSNTVRLMDPDGRVMMEKTENDRQVGEKGTSVFASRSQVHAQLMKRCEEVGVQVRKGVKVRSVDVERTMVFLDGGEELRADLIVAADGMQSVVRPVVIAPETREPYASTGHNAFRFMLSKAQIEKDDTLKSLLDDGVRMFVWHGKESKKWILSYPVDGGGGGSDANVSYSQKVTKETALKAYEEFEPRARRIIELADPESLRIWKMQDMDELPSWSKHNTVLLGDILHPVQPFSTAGAAMAIEDAVTLEILLDRSVQKAGVAGRLKLYEQIRKPRVARVRQEGRDRGLEKTGDDGYSQDYQKFLEMHDAVVHTREMLRGR